MHFPAAFRLDLLIDSRLIVEIKSVERKTDAVYIVEGIPTANLVSGQRLDWYGELFVAGRADIGGKTVLVLRAFDLAKVKSEDLSKSGGAPSDD